MRSMASRSGGSFKRKRPEVSGHGIFNSTSKLGKKRLPRNQLLQSLVTSWLHYEHDGSDSFYRFLLELKYKPSNSHQLVSEGLCEMLNSGLKSQKVARDIIHFLINMHLHHQGDETGEAGRICDLVGCGNGMETPAKREACLEFLQEPPKGKRNPGRTNSRGGRNKKARGGAKDDKPSQPSGTMMRRATEAEKLISQAVPSEVERSTLRRKHLHLLVSSSGLFFHGFNDMDSIARANDPADLQEFFEVFVLFFVDGELYETILFIANYCTSSEATLTELPTVPKLNWATIKPFFQAVMAVYPNLLPRALKLYSSISHQGVEHNTMSVLVRGLDLAHTTLIPAKGELNNPAPHSYENWFQDTFIALPAPLGSHSLNADAADPSHHGHTQLDARGSAVGGALPSSAAGAAAAGAGAAAGSARLPPPALKALLATLTARVPSDPQPALRAQWRQLGLLKRLPGVQDYRSLAQTMLADHCQQSVSADSTTTHGAEANTGEDPEALARGFVDQVLRQSYPMVPPRLLALASFDPPRWAAVRGALLAVPAAAAAAAAAPPRPRPSSSSSSPPGPPGPPPGRGGVGGRPPPPPAAAADEALAQLRARHALVKMLKQKYPNHVTEKQYKSFKQALRPVLEEIKQIKAQAQPEVNEQKVKFDKHFLDAKNSQLNPSSRLKAAVQAIMVATEIDKKALVHIARKELLGASGASKLLPVPSILTASGAYFLGQSLNEYGKVIVSLRQLSGNTQCFLLWDVFEALVSLLITQQITIKGLIETSMTLHPCKKFETQKMQHVCAQLTIFLLEAVQKSESLYQEFHEYVFYWKAQSVQVNSPDHRKKAASISFVYAHLPQEIFTELVKRWAKDCTTLVQLQYFLVFLSSCLSWLSLQGPSTQQRFTELGTFAWWAVCKLYFFHGKGLPSQKVEFPPQCSEAMKLLLMDTRENPHDLALLVSLELSDFYSIDDEKWNKKSDFYFRRLFSGTQVFGPALFLRVIAAISESQYLMSFAQERYLKNHTQSNTVRPSSNFNRLFKEEDECLPMASVRRLLSYFLEAAAAENKENSAHELSFFRIAGVQDALTYFVNMTSKGNPDSASDNVHALHPSSGNKECQDDKDLPLLVVLLQLMQTASAVLHTKLPAAMTSMLRMNKCSNTSETATAKVTLSQVYASKQVDVLKQETGVLGLCIHRLLENKPKEVRSHPQVANDLTFCLLFCWLKPVVTGMHSSAGFDFSEDLLSSVFDGFPLLVVETILPHTQQIESIFLSAHNCKGHIEPESAPFLKSQCASLGKVHSGLETPALGTSSTQSVLVLFEKMMRHLFGFLGFVAGLMEQAQPSSTHEIKLPNKMARGHLPPSSSYKLENPILFSIDSLLYRNEDIQKDRYSNILEMLGQKMPCNSDQKEGGQHILREAIEKYVCPKYVFEKLGLMKCPSQANFFLRNLHQIAIPLSLHIGGNKQQLAV